MTSVDTVVLGLSLGLLTGAVFARSGACFNNAVRTAAFDRDRRVMRVFAVAVALQLALLPLLQALGAVELTRIGIFPVAQLVGGLAFGIGMALAGGCIAGILWKTGSGSMATAIALAGFVAGEIVVRGPGEGLLDDLDAAGSRPTETTLFGLVGVDFAALALPLGLVGLLALARPLRRAERRPAGLRAGLALGAVGAVAWVIAEIVDYGYGLGFAGSAESARAAVSGGDLGVIALPFYVALGVIGGAFLGAGRQGLRLPDGSRMARAALGGSLMGAGASAAHGCNIGHVLTGIPVLSLGSIWTGTWMTIGAVAAWGLVLRDHPSLRGTERQATTGDVLTTEA